jgi:membrane-associated protease RseP (regulator of RpoE activity)
MYSLLIVYLFGTLLSSIHTASHAIAGRALGAEVEEIELFWGPTIARIRLGVTLLLVKLLPGPGGRVKLRGKGGDEFNTGFNDLHPMRRILIVAAGTLAVLAVASACLGPRAGIRSVGHGFRQVVRGGLAPEAIGAPLVRSMLHVIRTRPWRTGLGTIAAKMAALNLLPLLPLDGGQILWNLVQWRRRVSDRITFGVTYVGLLASLILCCGWLYAITRVLIAG